MDEWRFKFFTYKRIIAKLDADVFSLISSRNIIPNIFLSKDEKYWG